MNPTASQLAELVVLEAQYVARFNDLVPAVYKNLWSATKLATEIKLALEQGVPRPGWSQAAISDQHDWQGLPVTIEQMRAMSPQELQDYRDQMFLRF